MNILKSVKDEPNWPQEEHKPLREALEGVEEEVHKERAAWIVPRRALRHGPHPTSRLGFVASLWLRRMDL